MIPQGNKQRWLASLSIAAVATAAIGGMGLSTLRAQQSNSSTATSPAASPETLAQASPSPSMCPPAAGGQSTGMGGMGGMGGMMHSMQVNSEFEFVSQMIPHHQEAIDTAKIVRDRTQRPEMRQFTQAIIDAQSREVADMQGWLKTWYPGQTNTRAYEPMMRPLANLSGDALDRQFLQDMVHHHHGAVMMANQLLQKKLVQHPPVQTLANNVIRTQTQEISQMQSWLTAWFKNDATMCGRPNAGMGMDMGTMQQGGHGGMMHH
ncbi:MAG TPA: DUF305 domain-containing protein [Coleofasciculaceae cyanobacterium]